MTTPSAAIANSTSIVMTSVATDPNAIGYISLGSLNETVKAVEVDGQIASADNIKDGQYAIARPFNIVTMGEVAPTTKDFMNYIMSKEGQAIIEESGYIAVNDAATPYAGSNQSGKIVISGSTSVGPAMEKLAESYQAINPDVKIEINQSGSTSGITMTVDGTCDIGMASRDIKDSELEKGVNPTVIAQDGIAVIVNKENSVTNLTVDQIAKIYTGEASKWEDVA